MSDLSVFNNIVSSVLDGKISLSTGGQQLAALGQTIAGQIEGGVAKVESALGPQATADINTALTDANQAVGGALTVIDSDLQPYVASGAKAVETAVDTVMGAALGAGGTALSPLVNGGIDALAGALSAAMTAQVASWKAKLAAAAPPAIAPVGPAQ